VIVWLNGPFGVGKTTTARALLEAEPGWVLFDPEQVGFMLRHVLAERRPVPDFQDWVSWRRVVVASLASVHDELADTIVVPQTVVTERYWHEIAAGLQAHGLPLHAFTLHADHHAHNYRISTDTREVDAADWRRLRRADYDAASGWLFAATTTIDTTRLSPEEVGSKVRASIGARTRQTPHVAYVPQGSGGNWG
jgi:AAA domain